LQQAWTKSSHPLYLDADVYELVLSVVQPEDSGLYHCILPNNQRSTIRLYVKGEKKRKCVWMTHQPLTHRVCKMSWTQIVYNFVMRKRDRIIAFAYEKIAESALIASGYLVF
jgi:hypothetical protein